mgnify:FL=1
MSDLSPMVNVDGEITPMSDATIPVMDRGFLYGDSVYEVFRTHQGVPLFMNDHFERLENSAGVISMEISQSREQLVDQIRTAVQATGATRNDDLYVRYQITRGVGAIDLYPGEGQRTTSVIIVKSAPVWNPDFYRRGLSMAIPRVRRNPVDSLDPNIKGGNYLNNVIAVTQARQLGADDCVMLDSEDYVTESGNSNIWFMIDGELKTPGAGNLRGLTKKHLHIALAGAGVSSIEVPVHVGDIARASECFVTSATREVMPCLSLRLEDGSDVMFPEGGGQVTRQARTAFKAYLHEYIAAHEEDRLV